MTEDKLFKVMAIQVLLLRLPYPQIKEQLFQWVMRVLSLFGICLLMSNKRNLKTLTQQLQTRRLKPKALQLNLQQSLQYLALSRRNIDFFKFILIQI